MVIYIKPWYLVSFLPRTLPSGKYQTEKLGKYFVQKLNRKIQPSIHLQSKNVLECFLYSRQYTRNHRLKNVSKCQPLLNGVCNFGERAIYASILNINKYINALVT